MVSIPLDLTTGRDKIHFTLEIPSYYYYLVFCELFLLLFAWRISDIKAENKGNAQNPVNRVLEGCFAQLYDRDFINLKTLIMNVTLREKKRKMGKHLFTWIFTITKKGGLSFRKSISKRQSPALRIKTKKGWASFSQSKAGKMARYNYKPLQSCHWLHSCRWFAF